MQVTVQVTLGHTRCNPYAIGRPAIRPQDSKASRTKVGLSRARYALNCTKISDAVHQCCSTRLK